MGFAWSWLALACRKALLARFRDFERRHGTRAGPTLAPLTGGSPACPATESARKDPRPEEKSFLFGKKKVILYIVILRSIPGIPYKVPLRNVDDVKSRG